MKYASPFDRHTPRIIGQRTAQVSTNEIKPSSMDLMYEIAAEMVPHLSRITSDRPKMLITKGHPKAPIADLIHGRTAPTLRLVCQNTADFRLQTLNDAQIMKSRLIALLEAADNVEEG